MKKIITMLGLGFLGVTAMAQSSQPSSSFDVSANVMSGCAISGTDFNFADAKFDDLNKSVNGSIYLQCSKGVEVLLSRTSFHGTGANSGQMRLESDSLVGFIQYQLFTTSVANNSDMTVTARPAYEYLGTYDSVGKRDHRLGIKLITGNKVTLPIRATYSSSSFTLPGKYSDTATYTVTF